MRGTEYDQFREAQAKISRKRSAAGREIGPLPAVADPQRRAAALASLRVYCETYHAPKFFLAWSDDHLEVIARLEQCVTQGGLFALAMPRGSGKSALAKAAVEWAVLRGSRRFVVLIGATDGDAASLMRDIKASFESNDLLLADFPEVCFPVHRMERITQRAKAQTLDGRSTAMVWKDTEIRLADVPGSAAAGAIVWTRGITGAIRGANSTGPAGETMRPDMVLCDDPQTRESAKSFEQTNFREAVIQGDILELAGPATVMAGVGLVTVIFPRDLADRLLDGTRNATWGGRRFKAVRTMPTQMALWEEYANIRADSYRAGRRGEEGTEFLQSHWDAMHEGADVAWPARVKPGDLDALQTAMNVRFDKPAVFQAEWQNDPNQDASLTECRQLTEEDLARKLNRLPRGLVPRECNRLTAFVDVQQEILFWAVCGWTERFGGALVDYGTFPGQPTDVFSAGAPPRKLSDQFPNLENRARIYSALTQLVPRIIGQPYKQADADGVLSPSLCLIDAGYEPDAIHDFLSRSPLRPVLHASKGRYVGPNQKPLNEYRREPGDRVGWNWRIEARTQAKGRYVSFDTNEWKTFVAEAVLAPAGASGSFYLPGPALQPQGLLAQHLLAEYRMPVVGLRRIEEWRCYPDQRENHWWDCVIGAAVAASVSGVSFSAAVAAGEDPAQAAVKKRRRLSDVYAAKHGPFAPGPPAGA